MSKNSFNVLKAVALLLAFGTAGYSFIEGWNFGESFYMTVITITTTGYQEVNPLTPEGRIFTIFLLMSGVATIAYATNVIIYEWVSVDKFQLRRKKVLKKIGKLEGHTIICGFGRMGKIVCQELWDAGEQFVVLDKNPENFKDVPEEYLWLLGDATSDELLLEVGIKKARALASMVDSDADCLYLTLAAHSLNPDVEITARFSSDSAALKLKRAGASKVIQPLRLSGQRVAHIIMNSEKKLETIKTASPQGDLKICEKRVAMVNEPQYWGMSLKDYEDKEKVIVACCVDVAGSLLPRPEDYRVISKNDVFVTIRKDSSPAHLKLVS